MARSTTHYADADTNNVLKKLHNKLRPAGTPVQRVEYIIELLLLRIFEVKLKQDPEFKDLRKLFTDQNEDLLFSSLYSVANERLLPTLNEKFFPFYATILSQARKVYKKNLGQKVQDQLVLIEEVFKNSNFTNNVKSGNLQEVLSLIGELDEERLLKTDLLGDAIESALSETGGTKDIGLHRTPDHIRHFMVALADPTFNDTIFDPACGTAGFLFDSFGYVLEAVSQDGRWPGQKAHPELSVYFKKHFAKRQAAMPSQEKAITFYRSGISGVEYLGMIRKMAAINFYIRGLNPARILQGDSLAMFNKEEIVAGTSTVVLANPPFGAERDQEAYPNVWEEFSRESETTILFVKLMFDALAPGGRCAVIVSEGFLTWDQTSARNLRKMLIEQANLKAIVSLPQGVFVSKGGVGPKTSILFFEKDGPTKEVWFYKVTNDGYTMGTNRRPIEGCQLVEALELFDKYLRHGKTPPKTKHSFTIPADWILTLDPRVKQRIEADTTVELSEKASAERVTLAGKLAAQINQRRLSKVERDERLVQHNEVWRSKTLNEIAKRIERAHLFSFNLPNYRSSLSKSQLDDWDEVLKGSKRHDGGSLDERFAKLKGCPPQKAHIALAHLNVQSALESDIARQYLMGFPVEELQKYNRLAELRKIIESGAKYPRVRLGEHLRLNTDRISPSKFPETRFRVLGVSNTEGVFLNETKPGAEIKQTYYRVKPNEFCYNPYRVNVGSIGLNEFDYDNQIISGAYNVFGTDETELLPHYLLALFQSPQFLAYVNEKPHGGVRMNFKFEYLEEWEVPLPRPERQREIAASLRAFENQIVSASVILSQWDTDRFLSTDGQPMELGSIVAIATSTAKDMESVASLPYVGSENIESGTGLVSGIKTVGELGIKGPVFCFAPGQLVYAKIRPNLRKCFVASFKGVCSADIYPLDINADKALPEYMFAVLASRFFAEMTAEFDQRAGIPKINRDQLYGITIPLPPRNRQIELTAAMKRDTLALDGLRALRASAGQAITDRVERLWSE